MVSPQLDFEVRVEEPIKAGKHDWEDEGDIGVVPNSVEEIVPFVERVLFG